MIDKTESLSDYDTIKKETNKTLNKNRRNKLCQKLLVLT